MGDRPPGFEAPRAEGGCFNCGSQLHFAYACPEPTRKEPHGAEVFRQRQAAKSMQSHGGQGSPNNRSKGLVITRYGPPPSQYPPPAPQNAWGPPGGPYPPPAQPPNPYAQQPPAPYPPPATQGLPPYPPPYQNVNPPAGVYGPPVPPPPPAPGPSYGQYGQPSYPPPAPPQSYAPPGPYGPPSYAPPYQPPNPGYHAALRPQVFPQASRQVPLLVFLQVSPQVFLRLHRFHTHQPRTHRAMSLKERIRPPTLHQQVKVGTRPLLARTSHAIGIIEIGAMKETKVAEINNPGGAMTDTSVAVIVDIKGLELKEDSIKTIPRTEDARIAEKDSESDEEFSWDLEKAFVVLDTKPADPVGKPLAVDWSDEPTIPPAYNAKCVRSAFCDPEKPETFKFSVRGSKQWPNVKRDPIFRYRRGMVVIRFPGTDHEYFTYHFSRKVETDFLTDREVVPRGPSDSSLNDTIKPSMHYSHGSPAKDEQSVSDLNNGKRSHDNTDENTREVKRLKSQPERIPHSLPPRPMTRPRSRSPPWGSNINVSLDPWSPKPDEAGRPDSSGRFSRSPGSHRLQKEDSNSKGHLTPRDSTQRYDSGYQSGYAGDRSKTYRERSHSRRLSPPPSRRGRDDREHSRDRSRDDQTPRKWSPSYAKARARTRSPSPVAVASDSESADLSDLEYELLGMERPEKKKKKKAAPSKSGVKRRQVKLNDAFGRRW
ncbi:hypothetical protein diail_634 [Diaporthe ilicicola]|nr:hypothetical protein diail_634 [Diaporthe ilicicola]